MRSRLLAALAAAGLVAGAAPAVHGQTVGVEAGAPAVRPPEAGKGAGGATASDSLDGLIEDLLPPADPGLADPLGPIDPDAVEADAPATPATAAAAARPATPLTADGLRASLVPAAALGPTVRPVRPVQSVLPVTGAAPIPVNTEEAARQAFEPIGLRVRTFTVFASATTGMGWSSNPSESPDGEGEAYWRLGGEVIARSDADARAGLDLTLRGGIRDYAGGDREIEPSTEFLADGRYDVTEVDRLTAGLRYSFATETGFSAETGPATGADIHTLSATAGYTRAAGLIGLSLRGAVDRTIYDGDDRDNTLVSGTLRLTLDSGAVFEPFVETSLFTRLPDRTVDEAGFRRSSVGGEMKVGTSVDTGLVTGEMAVGYATEVLDDDRLDPLRGMLVEASLAWAITPLTTITLTADTLFETSRLADASGAITRSAGVAVAHALRPNLILDAGGVLSFQDYEGIDRSVTRVAARAGAAWRLNRSMEVTLSATHEVADSSVNGEDIHETTVEAGITVRP